MLTIGLVGEGYTDHKVLENIVTGYFDDRAGDRIDFRYRPELGDETYLQQQEHFGGWLQVLKYCASEEFRDGILEQDIDYYVVQIDTDTAHETAYLGKDIKGKTIEEQLDLVREKLIAQINLKVPDFYEKYAEKIIFAIAINETECWLLPLFYKDSKRKKTNNCLHTLNQKLGKDKLQTINPKDKNPKLYNKYSRDFMKQKKLKDAGKYQESLQVFIDNLQTTFQEWA